MFKKMIESAFHAGGEMIIHIKGQEEGFRGIVQDFDGEFFTLFHNGCCNGLVWAFRLEDVLTCALVVPIPQTIQCAGFSNLNCPEEGDPIDV
jgi:hypothetical protein